MRIHQELTAVLERKGWNDECSAILSSNNYMTLKRYIVIDFHGLIDFKYLQKKQTPLHLAASAGQLAVCSLLLELGASLDATDDYGQKPIHLAAQSNKAEVVKVLLKLRPNSVSVATKVNITNRILWMISKLK